MCGIVGYLGDKHEPKEVIINGLKKLEYRGYDSAGITVIQNNSLKRLRAKGKLVELEKIAHIENLESHIGIGHTRWATHGVPSERNAHPHQAGGVSLVHNGIIENYLELREELLSSGAQIESDTDSELVAHLIARELIKTKNLFKAVTNIKSHLRGAYSILVIWKESPNEMVAFKDGPPMVVGLGEGETFIASDVQALLQYTKKFIYLSDHQMVHIQGKAIQLYDEKGNLIQPQITELNWSPDLVEKQGYQHFMLKEIYEQPSSVAAAMGSHINLESFDVKLKGVGFGGIAIQDLDKVNTTDDEVRTLKVLKNIDRVFIIACGTSFYAAQVAKYLIEKIARVPVEVDIASEFRYRDPVIPLHSLAITISQSGETADTLAALRLAKKLGAQILSICNVKNSSIDREAHGHLYMNCGPEIGVASTKAFVSTLTVLNLLALSIAKARDMLSKDVESDHLRALLALPSQMEGLLAYDKYFAEAASKLKKFKGFMYLGRGINFPIAMEGALKLKELAYLHAEGYAAGEMKHGPLAMIDDNMAVVMIAPQDEVFEKCISNLEETRSRGGRVITISTGKNVALEKMSEYYLSVPKTHWATNPVLAVMPLQLMAYHLALAMNHDVDKPRNLAKSVTVE
jgi:glucosamine--fructose-6-phosphate aminotransferase (isomerizing)